MKAAMMDRPRQFVACRMLVTAAMFVIAATTAAVAQNVVVFVNGEPITAIDVEQRMKFIQLSTQKTPPRQDVIEELINDKLKVREAKRWGIEVPDSEIDSQFTSMAGRLRRTTDQLAQELTKAGASAGTLKAQIRANLAWQQLVRGRYQSSLQLSEKDIQSALEAKKPDDKDDVAFDYVMRPILLLVPPGSPPTVFEGRRKEAEALRGRFRSCEEGIGIARSLRDVAVRDRVIRTSADLPEPLRKVLDSIPIGHLTAPEITRLGVEMFAICAKQESKADSPGKRQARDAIYAERFEQQSTRYLQRLRREALIDRR